MEPDAEEAEQVLLRDGAVLERLVRREVVVLSGADRPPGRGELALAPMTLEGDLLGCICVEGDPAGVRQVDDLTADTLAGLANMPAHVLIAARLRPDVAGVLARELLQEEPPPRRHPNRPH